MGIWWMEAERKGVFVGVCEWGRMTECVMGVGVAGEVWVHRFAYDWLYPRVELLWYDLPAIVR